MEIRNDFITSIKAVLLNARSNTYKFINSQMLLAYWQIGKMIVEEEQAGEKRAEYGIFLLKNLARELGKDFGKGFDERELRRIRQFYLCFSIRDTVRPELSWSHYRLIIRIQNETERLFYIKETIEQHWSTRVLDRNISTQYFQRLLSNKTSTGNIADDNTTQQFIKDPYVLEFLNLPNSIDHKERAIEKAIIKHLKQFLLELGKGFAFVAQQKLIRTESTDFYIDLVFYNYLLKCFVIIDIKNNKITHQDVGQLDMYVRMYNELEKTASDNPTIGILLCSDTDNIVAKYSVLNDNNNLFASKYQLYLPTELQLQEWLKNEPLNLDSHE